MLGLANYCLLNGKIFRGKISCLWPLLYNNGKYNDVPIWAIFEILTLGDFGTFISCLNQSTRKKISNYINLDLSGDTNVTLIYQMVYVIKDLRNAVAHNDIIFDTRFSKTDTAKPLKVCLIHDVGISYANFKAIVDYFVLIVYILKKLKVPKIEIMRMISLYEKSIKELQKEVSNNIYSMIVHADTEKKINDLRAFIKK